MNGSVLRGRISDETPVGDSLKRAARSPSGASDQALTAAAI